MFLVVATLAACHGAIAQQSQREILARVLPCLAAKVPSKDCLGAARQYLHREALAPVRLCLADKQPSEDCLRASRESCATKYFEGQIKDPFAQSLCLRLENEGWDELRLKLETKLETDLLEKVGRTRASTRAARHSWEAFRDAWCETEGRTAPSGVTGDSMLATEECRKALVKDRIERIQRVSGWVNY